MCARKEAFAPGWHQQDLGTTGTTTIVPRRCRPASQDPLAPLMGPRERERHCNGIKGAIELPKNMGNFIQPPDQGGIINRTKVP